VALKPNHAQLEESREDRIGQMTTTVLPRPKNEKVDSITSKRTAGVGAISVPLAALRPSKTTGVEQVAGFFHQASVSFVARGLTPHD
jgi:hypothetical protein